MPVTVGAGVYEGSAANVLRGTHQGLGNRAEQPGDRNLVMRF